MPNDTQKSSVKIESSWYNQLSEEFSKPYFHELVEFLKNEKRLGKTIFPPGPEIFSAFDDCPFEKVKVVIIGQDPYHGHGQAHGLCFSVNEGISAPPSLINIYKELKQDLGIERKSPCLKDWAEQGVLLLNAILTVEAGLAGSHQNKGWEKFTDAVIQVLNDKRDHLVFMLWGNFAKSKGASVSRNKHLVLESGHPSPLSAGRGHWFGNHHFSKANDFLKSQNLGEINW